jgi:hypothetical protein
MHHNIAALRQVARAYLVLASLAHAIGAPRAAADYVTRSTALLTYCARRARR